MGERGREREGEKVCMREKDERKIYFFCFFFVFFLDYFLFFRRLGFESAFHLNMYAHK